MSIVKIRDLQRKGKEGIQAVKVMCKDVMRYSYSLFCRLYIEVTLAFDLIKKRGEERRGKRDRRYTCDNSQSELRLDTRAFVVIVT